MSINGPEGLSPTLSNAFSLLELLSDGPRFQALLQEWADRASKHQVLLDQVGPAQNILELRRQLQEEASKLPGIKSDAESEARDILDRASAQARSIVQVAREEAQSIRNDATARATAAAESVKEAQRVSAEAESLRKQTLEDSGKLSTLKAELDDRQTQLDVARSLLEADRKKLTESLTAAQALLK